MKRSDHEAIAELLDADPERALALIHELADRTGDDPDIIAYEAECLAELGDFESALEYWAQYLEADPDYVGGYTERARLFTERGQFDAADAELRLCEELFGTQSAAVHARAFLCEARGDLESADEAFAQAAARDSEFEAPPRFSSVAVNSALEGRLNGCREFAVVPMPDSAGDEGFGRAFDVDRQNRAIIYQRNVERGLDADSTVSTLVEAIVQVWEDVCSENDRGG